MVVTPIFWAATGYTFDTAYKNLIKQYLGDAALDSDKASNVFSTLFEYNGSNGFINYRLQRGNMILDSDRVPGRRLHDVNSGPVYSDNSGYTTCLDDAQIQAEVNTRRDLANGFTRERGHMYVMFLPKHVESCFQAGNPVRPAVHAQRIGERGLLRLPRPGERQPRSTPTCRSRSTHHRFRSPAAATPALPTERVTERQHRRRRRDQPAQP